MKWHHPKSSRLMAEQRGQDRALRSSSDLRSWESTFSLIRVKSELSNTAAGSGMSCFPGAIYLFDAVSLIKRANHDSV